MKRTWSGSRRSGIPVPDRRNPKAACARRFRRGSGHRSRGSYPTVRPRRCTVLATCQQTGTSSRCQSGGNLADRTVRLHHRAVHPNEWIVLHGMPVTRPSRIAADMLDDKEDPEAVAQVIVDALRPAYDYPGTFADALAPYAVSFTLRRGDGLALLRWLLDTAGDPEMSRWIQEARAHLEHSAGKDGESPAVLRVEATRR